MSSPKERLFTDDQWPKTIQDHEKYHVGGASKEKGNCNAERSEFKAIRRKIGECCDRGVSKPKVAENPKDEYDVHLKTKCLVCFHNEKTMCTLIKTGFILILPNLGNYVRSYIA